MLWIAQAQKPYKGCFDLSPGLPDDRAEAQR
jgi:hypothetical protein